MQVKFLNSIKSSWSPVKVDAVDSGVRRRDITRISLSQNRLMVWFLHSTDNSVMLSGHWRVQDLVSLTSRRQMSVFLRTWLNNKHPIRCILMRCKRSWCVVLLYKRSFIKSSLWFNSWPEVISSPRAPSLPSDLRPAGKKETFWIRNSSHRNYLRQRSLQESLQIHGSRICDEWEAGVGDLSLTAGSSVTNQSQYVHLNFYHLFFSLVCSLWIFL